MSDFKPIDIADKETFTTFLAADPPETSELTFTNLFMWRHRYRPCWRIWEDCLLVVLDPCEETCFGLPPVGPGDKGQALDFLVDHLSAFVDQPLVKRVGKQFVERHVDSSQYLATPDPDNSDYVYLAEDLITLKGNRFHRKKNHLNKFLKSYDFTYRPLDAEIVALSLELQENWCEVRDCGENPSLLAEDMAVYEALKHYDALGFKGGAILIESRVEAFSLGEMLNPDTAVIHIEKANPDIPGLYAAINQTFCENAFAKATYVNREQDLGLEGLRKAKQSYNPHHMVEKYILAPK
jgi:hypothetical protein